MSSPDSGSQVVDRALIWTTIWAATAIVAVVVPAFTSTCAVWLAVGAGPVGFVVMLSVWCVQRMMDRKARAAEEAKLARADVAEAEAEIAKAEAKRKKAIAEATEAEEIAKAEAKKKKAMAIAEAEAEAEIAVANTKKAMAKQALQAAQAKPEKTSRDAKANESRKNASPAEASSVPDHDEG